MPGPRLRHPATLDDLLLYRMSRLLAVAGSMAVHLLSARETLQTQMRMKNSDNAQALALSLSQQQGDARLMEIAMAAQFDTGFYRSIRLVRTDGTVFFERRAESRPLEAPRWFVARVEQGQRRPLPERRRRCE